MVASEGVALTVCMFAMAGNQSSEEEVCFLNSSKLWIFLSLRAGTGVSGACCVYPFLLPYCSSLTVGALAKAGFVFGTGEINGNCSGR
jgi:hypothetical protein